MVTLLTGPPHENSVPCGGQATDQHVEYEVSYHLYYLLPAVCIHVRVCAAPTHTPTYMYIGRIHLELQIK